MFQVRLPCRLGLKSCQSVSINVNNKRRHFSRNTQSWRAHVSPMFPSFPCGKHCFQCLFLLPRYKLCLRYTAEEVGHAPNCIMGQYNNTISRAVRTSVEATEDPLKAKFLSSFRCKCWTLNVFGESAVLINAKNCQTLDEYSETENSKGCDGVRRHKNKV